MRVEEIFVTIAALMAFSIPFILVGYIRRLRYEELVTLAEQGLLREDFGSRGRRGNGKVGLRWGIVLTALGVALSCGLWPIGFVVDGFPLGLGPWMLLGFLPTAFGIALLLIHRLAGEDEAAPGGDAASMGAIPATGPYGVGIDRLVPDAPARPTPSGRASASSAAGPAVAGDPSDPSDPGDPGDRTGSGDPDTDPDLA